MSPTTSTIVAVPESRVDSSIYRGPLQACRVFCQRLGLNAITFQKKPIEEGPAGMSQSGAGRGVFSRGRQVEGTRASRIRGRPVADGKSFAQDPATSLPIARSSRKCVESQKGPGTSSPGTPSTDKSDRCRSPHLYKAG